jgi:pre-mRNA-splicing factor CWC26
MSSKLEYLKKYSVSAANGSDKKSDKKNTKSKSKGEAFRVRDVTEDLPAPKSERARRTLKDILLEGEDVEIVDKDLADAAQKIDVEKSGVAWRMSNHRHKGLRSGTVNPIKLETKAEVKLDPGDSDGDLSPVRAAKGPNGRHDSDADLSPPRAIAKVSKPPMRTRHDSDDDISPPRAIAKVSKPVTRTRHDSDDDMSPPRANTGKPAARKAAAKPPARTRMDSDEDLSPPRAASKPVRHDSDADLSPPRAAPQPARAKGSGDTSDLSPPRAAGGGKKKHDSDDDLSPPRAAGKPPAARHDSDVDLSPPRKPAGKPSKDAAKRSKGDDDDGDLSPPRKSDKKTEVVERMASGMRAGLVSGKDLQREAKELREERAAAIAAAPDAETGRNAETVYRGKDGKRVTREDWIESQQKKKKKRLSEYPEQELQWGGGVKQTVSAEKEREELTRIAEQPFARYEPDSTWQEAQKGKHDWLDPMKKKIEEAEEESLVPKQDGQVVAVKKPKCRFPPWPNRHGILPGYRWDGKVRGNGHEDKIFNRRNQMEWRKQEHYKLSELDEGG